MMTDLVRMIVQPVRAPRIALVEIRRPIDRARTIELRDLSPKAANLV